VYELLVEGISGVSRALQVPYGHAVQILFIAEQVRANVPILFTKAHEALYLP
jgi:hypothetical protein